MAVCLAFDTSQAWCAAALVAGGRTVTRIDEMARGQAEHLLPMLEEMLAGAGLGWSDLEVIGVGTGPGNFTGIRISVAAARGLAMARGITAVGISAFEAAGPQPLPRWVAVDAPRGQVYLQRFDPEPGPPELAPAERLARLDAPLIRLSDIPPGDRIANIAALALARRDQPMPPPAPLYVRPADAAPPRQAAPVILP